MRRSLRLLLCGALLFCGATAGPPRPARAAMAPFLSTPYYGARYRTAYFDHRYPTYSRSPNSSYARMVDYTGYDGPSCEPVCYDGHDGTDFGIAYEPILAAADGTVSYAGWQNPLDRTAGYGLNVRLEHPNGYATRYAHLSAVAVSVGQSVVRGQIIGTSGSTGNSTGPHLHFGVLASRNGVYAPVDPFGWRGGYPDPWAVCEGGMTSDWLWVAGDLVGTPLTPPATRPGLTVDEGDAAFTKGDMAGACPPGSCTDWYAATGYGQGDSMWWSYLSASASDARWARWQPAFGSTGVYEVYVFIPRNYGTSWAAPYEVAHLGGISTARVDQWGTFDRWLCLGAYTFAAGSGALNSVRVHTASGEGDLTRMLGVDALRVVPRGAYPSRGYLPQIVRAPEPDS